MGTKRVAETNQRIVRLMKQGKLENVYDEEGVRHVRRTKVSAPNTERKAVRRSFLGTRIFYNCPKCGKVLENRKKMHRNLCMNCGQYLDWGEHDKMSAVYLMVTDADDALYWAEQYKYYNGETYGIDLDIWRRGLSVKKEDYPTILFFPFPAGKAYGRFMRQAPKEGIIITYF